MEKRSLRLCVTFLEQIAKQTSTVVLEICAEQCNLNDQVMPESISGFQKNKLSTADGFHQTPSLNIITPVTVCRHWI